MEKDKDTQTADTQTAELQWADRNQLVDNIKYQLAKLAGQSEYSDDTVKKIGEKFSDVAEVEIVVEGVSKALKFCESMVGAPSSFSEQDQKNNIEKLNNIKDAVTGLQETRSIFEVANSLVGVVDDKPNKVKDEVILDANRQASNARASMILAAQVLSGQVIDQNNKVQIKTNLNHSEIDNSPEVIDRLKRSKWELRNPMQAKFRALLKGFKLPSFFSRKNGKKKTPVPNKSSTRQKSPTR